MAYLLNPSPEESFKGLIVSYKTIYGAQKSARRMAVVTNSGDVYSFVFNYSPERIAKSYIVSGTNVAGSVSLFASHDGALWTAIVHDSLPLAISFGGVEDAEALVLANAPFEYVKVVFTDTGSTDGHICVTGN